MTMVKPKHCGQDWSDMKPTKGGRICGQCNKLIVDFSKMSWTEIEKIQLQNNNSVCGMYKPKQLDYWGQEIPRNNFGTLVTTTALAISLTATTQLVGQVVGRQDNSKRTILRGTVTGKTQAGSIDTLGYSSVMFKNT